MDKLTLPPDEDGYSFKDGIESIRTQQASGGGRFRPGTLNASLRLSVQWTCDATEYEYLRTAYRTHVSEGHAPFAIDLLLDTSTLVEHSVRILPGSFGLQAHSGEAYVVTAVLEVLPARKSTVVGPMAKLTIPPDPSGYTFTDQATAEHVETRGGFGRVRRDQVGVAYKVAVSWKTNAAGYLYLRNYYRDWIASEQDYFPIDLLLETAAVSEKQAKFIPGTMGLDSVSGETFSLSAQLEVKTDETLGAPPGGTGPWLYFPTVDTSLAPLHQNPGGYDVIADGALPEPFVYAVGVTDNDGSGNNVNYVTNMVIPLVGDSGIPGVGEYTWEPSDVGDTTVPVFSTVNPSGGAWSATGPNLFVSFPDRPSIWAGGVLTLYAGNDPVGGAGQITIITFGTSAFLYPPVSIVYGPLA